MHWQHRHLQWWLALPTKMRTSTGGYFRDARCPEDQPPLYGHRPFRQRVQDLLVVQGTVLAYARVVHHLGFISCGRGSAPIAEDRNVASPELVRTMNLCPSMPGRHVYGTRVTLNVEDLSRNDARGRLCPSFEDMYASRMATSSPFVLPSSAAARFLICRELESFVPSYPLRAALSSLARLECRSSNSLLLRSAIFSRIGWSLAAGLGRASLELEAAPRCVVVCLC